MNFDELIRAARGGHTRENLLVKIVSQAVLDDIWQEHYDYNDFGDPIEYTYPLLSAHNGVLRLSVLDAYESSGERFYGGIQRITGLGDVFSGLLRSRVSGSGGTLAYQTDNSALMQEVKEIDWTSDLIEVRIAYGSQTWNQAYPLFRGRLDNASEDSGLLSWRIESSHYMLREEITPRYWNGAYFTPFEWVFPFGSVYSMPVRTDGTKSGADFVYNTSNYLALNAHYQVYKGTPSSTTEAHANYVADQYRRVTLTNSDGWTITAPATVPEEEIFVDVYGYDEGAGWASVNTAAAILETIFPLANYVYPDGIDVALRDLTIDYDSITHFKTKCTYQSGINVGGTNLAHFTVPTTKNKSVTGDYWKWDDMLETLVGDSNGIFTINNDNSLSFHFLYKVPTKDHVLTIYKDDYESLKATKLVKYKHVLLTKNNGNEGKYDCKASAGDYSAVLANEDDPRVLELTHDTIRLDSLADTYTQSVVNDVYNRWGEQDIRFSNCPIARGLNVGDVVIIDEAIAQKFNLVSDTQTAYGYVIGVDRGSEPFIDVRVGMKYTG